ncbi:MAG: DUF721 domain-containing protein [Ignavibacteria bacterium]
MNKRIDTRTRSNRMTCLEDEVDSFREILGIEDRMSEIKIIEVWNECVGETISKFAVPAGIKKNKLMVRVENSVWRHELAARKEEILKKLNANLQHVKNRKVIKEIVFV